MQIINESDLDSLIANQIEENTNLEYKDPDSLRDKKEIAKDVSAMANSNGGIIIYGLCEDNKDNKPTKIKWIENHQEKERMEQILQVNVTPKIDIVINLIFKTNDKSKFVLLVNVPQSEIAPHQDHADKNKRFYWRRNGFTTREMEHYEIEDLFFKRKRLLLEIQLKKRINERKSFDIILSNKGKVIGEKIMIDILIPGVLEIGGENWKKEGTVYSPEGMMISRGAEYKKYRYYQDKEPIFPGVPFESGIVYHASNNLNEISVGFLITCKDMELKRGIVTFKEGESSIKFTNHEYMPFPEWVVEETF